MHVGSADHVGRLVPRRIAIVSAELRPHGGRCDASSSLLHVLIREDALREFLLGAGHTGAGASIQTVNLKRNGKH